MIISGNGGADLKFTLSGGFFLTSCFCAEDSEDWLISRWGFAAFQIVCNDARGQGCGNLCSRRIDTGLCGLITSEWKPPSCYLLLDRAVALFLKITWKWPLMCIVQRSADLIKGIPTALGLAPAPLSSLSRFTCAPDQMALLSCSGFAKLSLVNLQSEKPRSHLLRDPQVNSCHVSC
jgi:hypothetical protein